MIFELIGGLIGKNIDQSDGEGGTLGAIVGVGAAKVIKGVFPLLLLAGGAYAVKRAYDRRAAV
jgi:hypothetical protein